MDKLLLIIFIIIRIFSNPTANIFQKKLSSSYSSITINFYTYLTLSVLCLYNIDAIKTYRYNTEFIILVIICGFLCTTGMICMIKAINIGELSVLGPINSYKSVISLIIAFFILGETPPLQGLLGVCLVVLGSRYIFHDENKKFGIEVLKRKDIQLRFLAMTLTAVEAVLLKKTILISSVEICFSFWCFMGFLWSFILLISDKKSPVIKNGKSFFFMFVIAICLGLMQYSTNYVFSKMDVGLSLSIFQLSSVITVLFGWKIFKEKNIKTKLTGSFIMIIGSCLILLK
ncbi:MAG: EamA family transporter [Candidatus Avigastranaerophilus sp.]